MLSIMPRAINSLSSLEESEVGFCRRIESSTFQRRDVYTETLPSKYRGQRDPVSALDSRVGGGGG